MNPTFLLGGELEVRRLGFCAMRIVNDREEGARLLRRALELGVTKISSVQNQYNRGLLISDEVLNACEAEGIGFMPWSPLGEGLREPAYELRWLLDRSPVMLPIPGTSSIEHFEENMLAVAELSL